MRIINPKYFEAIEISEENPETLVFENGSLFRKAVSDLILQYQIGTGEYVLSDNNEIRDLPKSSMIITDPFSYSINSRTIKGKIQQIISDGISGDEQTAKVIASVESLSAKASNAVPYPVSFRTNINTMDLVKLLDFDLDLSELDSLERLIEYLRISKDLLRIQLAILINIKDVMNEAEYLEFCKEIRYLKIKLLMIERHCHEGVDDKEHIQIVDKDLCVI